MKRTHQDLFGFEDGRRWPQTKECEWPLESGISKKIYSLLESLKEPSPAGTLNLDH